MLHLTATDSDDLSILSMQMQDAVIRFSDIKYLAKQRRFALVANRFAWDALPAKTRRRTGVTFNAVMAAKRSGPKDLAPDTILSLLAVTFEASDGLSGTLTLSFAGGHKFALRVECVDAVLDDLGPAWSTENTPRHGEGA